jgi:hypothetical protein
MGEDNTTETESSGETTGRYAGDTYDMTYVTVVTAVMMLVIMSAPFVMDIDGDGSRVIEEIQGYHTSPLDADTDGDGIDDGKEVNTYDTNPTKSDTDEDGLDDGEEVNTYNTNPTKSDTDEDGLDDGEEVNTYNTNPTKSDTDEDRMSDKAEVNRGTNPTSKPQCSRSNRDTDSDGLSNYEECRLGTDPYVKDTDKDGITDYEEVRGVTDRGIKIDDSNPTHMDLYVTVIHGTSGTFNDSYQKISSKEIFSEAQIQNPNGMSGVDLHYNVMEDEDLKANYSERDYNRGELAEKYNARYQDTAVHVVYLVSETPGGKGIALHSEDLAIGSSQDIVVVHEVVHIVVGEIDGSECRNDDYHVCSERGLMNGAVGNSLLRRL